MPRILHLVDDTTPGGVMRVIDHLTTSPKLADQADHIVRIVSPTGALPAVQADVVVSHLSLSWQRLPHLIAFRARHAQLPLIHVEHSYTEAFTAQNVSARARFFTMLRLSFSLFDRVVAVSEAQGRWLQKRGLVGPSSLQVIPSAIDLSAFRAIPRQSGPVRVIGAIGRLHRQKGFDILIDAFRMLPDRDIALHIHGTGPEAAALAAGAAGDPRILFHGHTVSPVAAYSKVDLVAMPSRWEAFGLVALEARAAGRRLVCADVDGLRESGKGARFVRGASVRDWASTLAMCLTEAATSVASPDAHDSFSDSWLRMLDDVLPHKVMAA
ncbi:glycosyltransferase [Ponticoccus alexandrii]|uniref:Glycosyltransferase n=1 Tax=Ponticoccus alexandrii TaxID=1943633 RepID=A0ABX7FD47_9RHOB|nr:glycosyltransferase [Ponticoccus alexandrii]ETA51876.1 glycosyl transferase [Rhodobacteraceae bacterium PD-2]QRF68036.1 glycosyltransferase [Ponticoccus alexandrii]